MTENEAINNLACMRKNIKNTKNLETTKEIIHSTITSAIAALEEVQQYRTVGTIEECQEAIERQKGKKYKTINMIRHCSECDCMLRAWYTFCPDCGQAIDWSDT